MYVWGVRRYGTPKKVSPIVGCSNKDPNKATLVPVEGSHALHPMTENASPQDQQRASCEGPYFEMP